MIISIKSKDVKSIRSFMSINQLGNTIEIKYSEREKEDFDLLVGVVIDILTDNGVLIQTLRRIDVSK